MAIIEIAVIRLVIAGDQDYIVLGDPGSTASGIVCILLWLFWISRRGYRGVSIPSLNMSARGLSICRHGEGEKDLAAKGDVCHCVSSVERKAVKLQKMTKTSGTTTPGSVGRANRASSHLWPRGQRGKYICVRRKRGLNTAPAKSTSWSSTAPSVLPIPNG